MHVALTDNIPVTCGYVTCFVWLLTVKVFELTEDMNLHFYSVVKISSALSYSFGIYKSFTISRKGVCQCILNVRILANQLSSCTIFLPQNFISFYYRGLSICFPTVGLYCFEPVINCV